jgi:hypothetical protein
MQYTISDEVLSKVYKFSNEINTSFYSSRNQFNNDKRKRDQVVGKLGEFGVYNYVSAKFPDLSQPDLNIYEVRKKSWDFDLKASNLNLHVKSQDVNQGKRYGVSWIFQVGDKEIFNPKLESYVSFTSVDLDTNTVKILGFVKVQDLHDKKLFKLPKLKHLQEMNKLAVYYSDLEPLGDSLFPW